MIGSVIFWTVVQQFAPRSAAASTSDLSKPGSLDEPDVGQQQGRKPAGQVDGDEQPEQRGAQDDLRRGDVQEHDLLDEDLPVEPWRPVAHQRQRQQGAHDRGQHRGREG